MGDLLRTGGRRGGEGRPCLNARRTAAYLWAAPVSLAALPAVGVALATGGRARVVDGVLESGGGILGPLLSLAVPLFPIGAITFGHVVLGASEKELESCRAHERIHVRQYERWGVLFPLLYLASSAGALLRGRSLYADNAFEREAFRAEPSPPEREEVSRP